MDEETKKLIESLEVRIKNLENKVEILEHANDRIDRAFMSLGESYDKTIKRCINLLKDIDHNLENQKQHIQILENWVNRHG